MNRNIITEADVQRVQQGAPPAALVREPPAWTDAVAPVAPGGAGGQPPPGTVARLAVAAGAPTGPGGVPIPTADDYLTKLIKYIPIEVLGGYLFFAGVVNSNVSGSHDLAAWLGYGLAAFAAIAVLYSWRVLKIVRVSQIVIGVIALGAYVFATGGWFATWYHSWYASIVLPFFALLVAIIPVPPLPQQ